MNDALGALVRRLQAEVTEDRVSWETGFEAEKARPPTDEEALAWGDDAIARRITGLERDRIVAAEAALSEAQEDWLIEQVRVRVFGLGVLDQLLSDPRVENITANGCDFVRITYAGGEKVAGPPLADSDADLDGLIRRLAATAGRNERRFDDAHPYLDLQLPDGSRLHAIKGVSARPCVSIRRHRFIHITPERLITLGTIDSGLAHLFSCVARGPDPLNIVVAGGTDTGKTTFLRALVSQVPVSDRLVVIEDNSELALSADSRRDVIELETRQANVEGQGAIGMGELLRQSLRMRPDRVIVGEIRGGEASEMFKAMSTGNDGSMTTLHADSSLNAIAKMKLYGLMADEALSGEASAQLIAQSIHLVVHLRKLRDGTRVVSSVREVTGVEGTQVHTNEVYAPGADWRAQPTDVGFTPRILDRLHTAGFDPSVMLGPSTYQAMAR